MRRQVFSVFLVLGFLGVSAALAANPQYRCEPETVDNDAVAVAHADVDVAAFSDPNQKACTFAIDGAAPPGATPGRQPVEELISNLLENSQVDGLVVRLTIAHPLDDEHLEGLRKRLKELFVEFFGDLSACFKALRLHGGSGAPKPIASLDSGTPAYSTLNRSVPLYLKVDDGKIVVLCTVNDPGDYTDLTTTSPTLRLSAFSHETKKQDVLYVPAGAAQ